MNLKEWPDDLPLDDFSDKALSISDFEETYLEVFPHEVKQVSKKRAVSLKNPLGFNNLILFFFFKTTPPFVHLK